MRTLILVGLAAIAALGADAAHAQHGPEAGDSGVSRIERRVIVVDARGEDDAVYRSRDDRLPTEHDYRGRWDGSWTGGWDEGREVYRGTYQGQYDARGTATHGDAREHERRIDRREHARSRAYVDHGYDYRNYEGRDYEGRGYDSYDANHETYGSYAGGTTTIVIPGAPTIIEETETTYETVVTPAPRARVAPRRAVRHRAPARPRPRCVCR